MSSPLLAIITEEMSRAAEEAFTRGMPQIELNGQLIRPLLAYAGASYAHRTMPIEFWKGALAVQLAHEASLIHDDVIDEASTRRGEPTIASRHGVARAVVHGDHLLTAAYRMAAETGSIVFVNIFAHAVERTVAGEIAQARATGRVLEWDEYRDIAEGKAGELLGCALALRAAIDNPATVEQYRRAGKHLGLLYQMLDDLLDYCPHTDTGKPALGDFGQKRWTWPLMELGDFSFDEEVDAVMVRLRSQARGDRARSVGRHSVAC